MDLGLDRPALFSHLRESCHPTSGACRWRSSLTFARTGKLSDLHCASKPCPANASSDTVQPFHIWLSEKGYFDFTKKADIKKDVVTVYSGPFNFFCYGNENDYRAVLKVCPMLDGEMRHFLFSTVRVWSTINSEHKKI